MNNSSTLRHLAAAALLIAAAGAYAAPPKYVFFFLGDGMAHSQIQATEAYLTTVNGGSAMSAEDLLKPENRLHMSRMPVLGLQTTYDSYSLMTDSASAATAFASGLKTESGVINRDPETKSICYKSVAQLAHENGKKVGVITSVSLDHATPAAYYASVVSRSDMNSIGAQMAESGYEFFGGGGLVKPTDPINVWDLLKANGYTVLDSREEILDLKENPMSKVVAINPVRDSSQAMPYSVDSSPKNVSLSKLTEVAVANLMGIGGKDDGFFLMVEGGKIDWACHANDAIAAIGDTLEFDRAVKVAIDFAKRHPRETLIVVTGDHETGGMSIGHATTAYTAYYEKLLGQKHSYEYFNAKVWAPYKAKNNPKKCDGEHSKADIDDQVKRMIRRSFGLVWDELNAYQQEKLEAAYDKSLCGSNDNSDAENKLLYGHYEPITVTLTHILNEVASIGWTSYSHTGAPTPVFAQGRNSEDFKGFYDNTDIAKRLAKILEVPTLPREKACP